MKPFDKISMQHDLPETERKFTNSLVKILKDYYKTHHQIIIICIGTDRSTGDSLGPLVGTYLTDNKKFEYKVYGTVKDPVHAMNLAETVQTIKDNHVNPFIIAVDACLGQLTSVGCVQINYGPLKPGAGVNKELPPIGNINVTGIVNVGGFMEYFVLQNTRLDLVMDMSSLIAKSLTKALARVKKNMHKEMGNLLLFSTFKEEKKSKKIKTS